jgi:ERCC4-related helicase
VINNLKISHIEMFTDESPDIKKHSFDKIIDKIVVGPNQLMQDLRRCILNILIQPVETLVKLGIFYQKNPENITCGSVIMTMKRVAKDKPPNLNVCQSIILICKLDFHFFLRTNNIKKLKVHSFLQSHFIMHLMNWKNMVYNQFIISLKKN